MIYQTSELKILSVADDTTASFSDADVTLLCQKVNFELAKPDDWFCANKLGLNAKIGIFFSYPRIQDSLQYIRLNGHPEDWQ